MEPKEKFIRDWEVLFPNSTIPDLLFFSSQAAHEKEFTRSEKRLSELRNELKKEEFIYGFLLMLKDDNNFLDTTENTNIEKPRPLMSASDHIESFNKIEVFDLNSEKSNLTFSSFQTTKLPSKSLSELKNSNTQSLSLAYLSNSTDSTTFSAQSNKSISNDENIEDELEKNLQNSSNPQSVVAFEFNQSSSSLRQDVFTNENKNNENLQSKKILPFPKQEKIDNDSDSSGDEPSYVNISQFTKKTSFVKAPESVLSKDEEFQPLNSPKETHQNITLKPILEHVVSISESETTPDINDKRQYLKKRHGSEDRKAFLFSDKLDVTNESIDSENLDLINNDSDENVFTRPSIIINVHEKDKEVDLYEVGEHLYIKNDCLKAGQSDDSGSENESALNASNNLPSTLYREMTSDEYASLQKWGESDEEGQSFDEEDSDDLPKKSFERKQFQKRLSSGIKISKSDDNLVCKTKSRPTSTLLSEKKVYSEKFPKEEVHLSEEDCRLIKATQTRKLVVMDLFENEKRYYDCLDMLMKFMKPLRLSIKSSQPILTAADFESIFGRAEELYELHKEFLNALEPRIENWNDKLLIGDLFVMIMQGFNLYSSYVGNYSHAMETVNKCRNANQQFKAVMEQDIKIPTLKDPLTLENLLYKPVDRITQYSLILNDLLKYTSPDHPDHPLIVEVSGALFDLMEQVNVDSPKKKKRQRQLLKEAFVVEIDEGRRSARSLILFNDVIISAKLKPARDIYVCKWYAGLSDISLKPYQNSEVSTPIPISSKAECDKLRANIANLRAEMRKDFMPLQNVVSIDNPYRRRNLSSTAASSRSSSRGVEKLKKKITDQEHILQLILPNIPLTLYHKNGKVFTFLLNMETEYQAWTEALRPRLKKIQSRSAESIHMSSLELQQALETVLKVQRLGAIVPTMPSPFLGPTSLRPLSVDFSKFDEHPKRGMRLFSVLHSPKKTSKSLSSPKISCKDPEWKTSQKCLFEFDDKDSLTGYLYVNISNGKGFNRNSDTYVVLEMDSYGHYFKKAKTKTARGSDPHWDEEFDLEIEACTCLRLTCYNKLRLMGDDISGKCSINLTRENLLDYKIHSFVLSLDRGQSSMSVSLSFATSVDGIKKTKSICETGVFGVPISVVCSREKSVIPVIVISCIKEIEKRGMEEVGIYRLSGVASEIQNLRKLFNEHTQNAVLVLGETDIHAVAGLLKLYFRELPQSLFTGKLYHKFVEGLSITDPADKEIYMLDTLHTLPRVNKLTTLYLFEHLRRVSLLESVNKMGINNLATVFGPTVLRTPSTFSEKENERSSCNVGTFDIGALDVMSQVGVFRYFLALKNNPRTCLPEDDLELWRRLDKEKAKKLEGHLLQTAEEFLI